jgi:integrase
MRKIFKEAFEAVGLPYYHPHSFRHTLEHLIHRHCQTVEQMLAWSQNLGHESPVTTITSYGSIGPYRQGDILSSLKK